MIRDQAAREAAIHPGASFIIQAPAGSGKTELLTQRYLSLLACVKNPEEIIALTFTRKAAAEMRDRIIAALIRASDPLAPETAHEYKTWSLGRAALENSQSHQWKIIEAPQRLRVQTIDSLSASLVRQMPVTSQFGALPSIAEDPERLYRLASEYLLKHRHLSTELQSALNLLRLHLDNQEERLATLFVTCLSRRDQWLSLLFQTKRLEDPRAVLERYLQCIVEENLSTCHDHLDDELKSEILAIMTRVHPEWTELKSFPDPSIENLALWQSLITFLMTQQFTWRKSFTKAQGILAPSSAKSSEEKQRLSDIKEQVFALVAQLESEDLLRLHFENLALSPPSKYSESQWEICTALLQILPALAAELTLVFRQEQEVDFAAIAHQSLQALGTIDDPSELALRLDYRISHILVDEFQDTSYSQFHLLEQLTAGWQPNDGRTLFIVGDPMQSIYRFRQAEVGLFLQAQRFGLGSVHLNSLKLSCNFRSCENMIEWVNSSFRTIFPVEDDPRYGAVSYAMADKIHGAEPQGGCHYRLASSKSDELQFITDFIHQELQESNDTIAILVKARRHLHDLLARLRQVGIEAQAIELDPLADKMIIRDLWSLTRALLHLGDRLAWLSVLRSPWVGLRLHDLLAISDWKPEQTIYENLIEFPDISHLSTEAQIRLSKVVPILEFAIAERQRFSLRSWVESTWHSLGGPLTLSDQQGIQDAEQFFQFLERQDPIQDFSAVEQQLGKILSSSYQASRVQVMTIHKSKGLEFDTVIIPSLEQTGGMNRDELLLWQEQTSLSGEHLLLMAPIKAVDAQKEALYAYCRREEKKKEFHENKRLLYVAITRAKKRCYLTATLDDPAQDEPRGGSFLNELWPSYHSHFRENVLCSTQSTLESREENSMISRLPQAWYQLQNQSQRLEAQPNPFSLALDIEARLLGTFIHQLLHELHGQDPKSWSLANLHPEAWESRLIQLGIPKAKIQACIDYATHSLQQLMSDSRAQWIYSLEHQEIVAELALQGWKGQQPKTLVIDRSFIDDSGTRWIIDFKTAEPTEDLSSFLASEKILYQTQLQDYALAFQALGDLPIRCALYYPSCGGWIEWEPFNAAS